MLDAKRRIRSLTSSHPPSSVHRPHAHIIFECFSLTSTTKALPLAFTGQHHMDEKTTPPAIAGTSPAGDGSLSSASLSMVDLSSEFERHSLQPSRQNLFCEYPPSRISGFYLPTRPNRNPTTFNSSQAALQQQQSMTRRQCSPAHLSKIHSLVENLASDGRPKSSYSSSTNTTSSESPLEDILPDLPSYLDRAPTSSTHSSENEESDSSPGYRRSYAQHKVSKHLRRSLSPEGMGTKNVVLKRIRYRKSFLRRRSVESNKRQDRQHEKRLG